MKILLMADYRGGYQITQYLKEQKEDIVGLVVHPPCVEGFLNKGYTQKIKELLNLPEERIFVWDSIKSGERLAEVRALNPDLILTMFCCGLLAPEVIAIPKHGCINIHMAYLPYSRGKNPNVWSIIDEVPSGITIHYIDEKIDRGDIIDQMEVPVESIDTGGSLYRKIDELSLPLFKRAWPKIKAGTVVRIPQDSKKATLHFAKDLPKISEIKLDETYTARKLINILRARTFPPHPSCYFIDEHGKKVNVRVQLEYANE
jgi:methionyl-tRNA formyltransferase